MPAEPLLQHGPPLYTEADMYAGFEATLLAPHLHSALTALVPLGTGSRLVILQNARLETTVSPRFELGMFRTPDSLGEIVLGYRFLVSDGEDITPGPTIPELAARRSRLDLQMFDLDYACNCHDLGPDTRLRWDVGGRFQVAFFDTKTQSAVSAMQANNDFFGAGPHAGCSVTQAVGDGLSFFGRFDAAVVYGYNTSQHFAVSTINPANRVATAFGTFDDEESAFSPSS